MLASPRLRPWHARCLAVVVVLASCFGATAAQAGWFDSLTGSEKRADVRVESLALDKRQARVGETVRATVAISNWGFLRAKAARLTLLAAPGANAQIGQAARLTSIDLGTLDGKARLSYVATFPVPSWAKAGAHRVFATIETRSAESKRGNNTTATTLEVVATSTSAQSSPSSPSLSIVTLPPPPTQNSPASVTSPPSAEPDCDFYASPTGTSSNDGLSPARPLRPRDFWALARPGKTLCLMDGVYRGDAFMLDHLGQSQPAPVGSSTSPVTVRALNDGRVRLDGQGVRIPVRLRDARWTILEGFNAYNSGGTVVSILGSQDVTIRRVIAWDAKDDPTTSYHVFNITSGNARILLEDVAAFGIGRKMIQIQTSDYVTLRRAWARHEGYQSMFSKPQKTIQHSYKSTNTLGENNIATWSHEATADGGGAHHHSMHQLDNQGGGNELFPAYTPSNPGLLRIFGAIGYLKCRTASFRGRQLYHNNNLIATNTLLQDVVAVIEPGCFGGVNGVRADNDASRKGINPRTITRASTWGGAGSNVIRSQWTQTAVGATNTASPATGNYGSLSSPWNPSGVNARLCFRYQDGLPTTTPLWPWPMDQRIRDALAVAGRSPLEGGTVTSEIEFLLGRIPAACRADGRGR
jgi:hypothetical protein